MKLLIGTNNLGKATEIADVLKGLPLTIKLPRDIGVLESPEETGTTFEENAREKALFYHARSQLPTIADDSGILVEALADELGLHTRRWGAGPEASDEEWIDFFLDRMHRESNKRAHFVCVLAYTLPGGETRTFEGRCSGVITDRLEAEYLPGLPISACFKPDGFDRVFSGLPIEQKNSTSHRGRASRALREFLELYLRAA